MPLYEFECNKCGVLFEELTGIGTGDSEVVCPMCGSKKVRKLLSTFSASAESGPVASQGCGSSGFS
jgi:putative FmdB family regulatory protein